MDKNSQNFAMVLTLFGAIFWGFSGACGQDLFERKGISAEYLTSLRLILSGVIMLAILYAKSGKFIFSIFSSKKNIYDLLFYALFGINTPILSQLSFQMRRLRLFYSILRLF